jgi:hypothetical protein
MVHSIVSVRAIPPFASLAFSNLPSLARTMLPRVAAPRVFALIWTTVQHPLKGATLHVRNSTGVNMLRDIPMDESHPRGTLAIVAVLGAFFALGWLAMFLFLFLERGAPQP